MYELRPEYFTPESFHDRESLLSAIYSEGRLAGYFEAGTLNLVEQNSPAALVAICDDLNRVLVDRTGKWGFYVARPAADGGVPSVEVFPNDGDIVATRRKALEAYFQPWLRPAGQRRPPMQGVLNAATSFAFADAPHSDDAGRCRLPSPRCMRGSARLGYRDAREYSTRYGGISLATAAAISSASAAAQEFATGGLSFFRNP